VFERLDRLALGPVRVAARSSRSILSDEAERVIDGVLAGPLPEAIARALVEHHVVERVVEEMLERSATAEGHTESLEGAVERVLKNPALERWVASGDAGRLVEPYVSSLVQSPVFRRTLQDVLSSPEIRHALTSQTEGFAAEVADGARSRGVRTDDALEAGVHRLLRLRRPDAPLRPFAGFASRGAALVLDAFLAQLACLAAAASVALVASLVGASLTNVFARVFTGAGIFVVAGAYFVGFWSTVGQTPGMRLLGVRVAGPDGTPPSGIRSVVRLAGLVLAVLPLGAGFLTALVDRRRRALQDFVAGTIVRYDADVAGPDEPAGPPDDGADASIAAPPDPPTHADAPDAGVLRSSWRQVGGVRMHSASGGSGPPVVLVHGFGVSGAYMIPLARELGSSFSTFVPDLPGQGRSEPAPRGPWGIAEMAEALGGWIEASGLREPIAVGNSLGCQIVTELAVRRPELVGPMVLVGPTVDPARRAARHQVFAMLRDSAREPLSLLAMTARNNVSADFRPLLAGARAALSDRMEERLPLIERTTVVVHGEADGFVSAEWAERVAALLPQGRLVVVPSEPHAVHYTRPDLVAGIVRELFLEEREQARRQVARRLEHGHVTARKAYDPRTGQDPVPLVG
jgi:pimeloyl-ACP methyl ester carboxylesterase/uncharacterized RDD family membrane protein YckC